MPITGTYTADASGIRRGLASILRVVVGANGDASDAYLEAGRVYMAFIRARYDSAAAGDGTWPPSAAATREGRDTLIDTTRLRASLEEGHPENVEIQLIDGVRVGTLVPYSASHQFGSGSLPARTILVEPDAATAQAISGALVTGFTKALTA